MLGFRSLHAHRAHRAAGARGEKEGRRHGFTLSGTSNWPPGTSECSPGLLSSSSPFPSGYPGTCSFGQALDRCREHSAHCSIRVTRCAHALRSSLLLAQLLAFANSHERTVLPHRTSLSPACPLRLHNAGNHRVHHRKLLGRAPQFKITRLLAVPRPRPPRTFNAAEMLTLTNEGDDFECGIFDRVSKCACHTALRGEEGPRCFRGLSFATSPLAVRPRWHASQPPLPLTTRCD